MVTGGPTAGRVVVIDAQQTGDLPRGATYRRLGAGGLGEPLLWDDDPQLRRTHSDQARQWAVDELDKTLRRSSSETAELLELCARDITAKLERMALVRSYAEVLIQRLGVAELWLARGMDRLDLLTLTRTAAATGTRVRRFVPSSDRSASVLKQRSAGRSELAAYWWLLRGRLLRRRTCVPQAGVVIESGSIQSVRNSAPVVAELDRAGYRPMFLGLQKFPDTQPGRTNYNPDGIAAIARAESGVELVHDLLEFVPLSGVLRSLKVGVRGLVAGAGGQWRWPGALRRAFNRAIAYDLAIACATAAAVPRFVARCRPKVFVVTDITNSCGRTARVFRTAGVQVLIIQDGVVSNEVCRRFAAGDFDRMAVWGEEFAHLLEAEFGWPRDRLTITGTSKVDWSAPLSRPLPFGPRILLLGQPADYPEDASDRWWRWVCEWAGTRPRAELAFRPHPRQDPEGLTNELAAAGIRLLTGTSLRADLEWSTVAVAQYSTTLFEGIAAGRPVISVDAASRTDLGHFLQLLPFARAADGGEVSGMLDRLHEAPGEWERILLNQQTFLASALSRDMTDPAIAIAGMVQQMAGSPVRVR